ncbi:MAG: adaptor protein MecA, partial [Clostridia bacterium]|nr:adaptor protein MecA [Clostridia bacterium]
MQIEKIDENQLEVTLNFEDLKKNNISLHSFMCNSIVSQNLFFDILNF